MTGVSGSVYDQGMKHALLLLVLLAVGCQTNQLQRATDALHEATAAVNASADLQDAAGNTDGAKTLRDVSSATRVVADVTGAAADAGADKTDQIAAAIRAATEAVAPSSGPYAPLVKFFGALIGAGILAVGTGRTVAKVAKTHKQELDTTWDDAQAAKAAEQVRVDAAFDEGVARGPTLKPSTEPIDAPSPHAT